MLIKQAPDIRSSEITPERVYRNRREFIRTASGAVAGAMAGAAFALGGGRVEAQEPIPNLLKSPFSTDEALNSFEDITTYNNFYEFGLDKGDPARYAHEMTIDPWSVRVEGEMNKPAADVPLETLLRPHPLEERIYRLRCVEAWSMVVRGWASPSATSSSASSRPRGRGTSVSRRSTARRRCAASAGARSTGRTSRGCGWTRPCTP